MIYPQRMELMGEESLMDVLQMMPELMIGGYEDVLSSYNLRIDNCPMNGDTRLILSQMKAKDIAKIQVCDNTGVAKGTIGMGRVLDINMKMPDALNGFVEGQGDFGGNPAVRFSYSLNGKKWTDCGDDFPMRQGKWVGAKFGFISAETNPNADRGWLEADWIRVTP